MALPYRDIHLFSSLFLCFNSKFQVEYEPSFLQMDVAERSSVGRVSFQKFNENVEVNEKAD